MTLINLIPQIYTNVKTFGALGDNSTDNTTFINNAITALSAAGGGTLFFPSGTYLSGTITLVSNVHLIGAGYGVSIIKLKNATNADLLSANTSFILLSGSLGSGNSGGISGWSIRDMTLDGNKANQSSGTSYCLRVYGYDFLLENIVIQNGYTGGWLNDWNGTDITSGEGVGAIINNMKCHHNNGVGIQLGGPHNTQFNNVSSFYNGRHNLHLAPNAQNTKWNNGRFYNPGTSNTSLCCLIEAPKSYFSNCEAGNSDNLQIAVLANDVSWVGGNIYANPAANVIGVQYGQNSGGTPFNGSLNQSAGSTTNVTCDAALFQTTVYDCQSGAINEINVGNNMILMRVHQVSGTAIASFFNYGNFGTSIWMTVSGLTPDGTDGAGGIFQPGAIVSHDVLVCLDINAVPIFTVNTFSGTFELRNGNTFKGYSDNGSTQKFSLAANTGNIATSGNIATGQSATAVAIANSATIATVNIGESRVAPTGNVTGIILAAGTIIGQEVVVVNESAFTVTFNTTPATSNVAGSAADPAIPAKCCRLFKWDSVTSLWYRAA
jgi:hypothetical protein